MPAARHVLTVLAVGDLPAATAFYREAFGFEPSVAVPVYTELRLPGGMRLGLYAREGYARNVGAAPAALPRGAVGPTELYFHVDDLAGACARLRAAGARELSPCAPRDWGDEAAYFADPEGNVLVVARPLA